MAFQQYNFSGIIEIRYPGLIQKIREVIRKSEKKYDDSTESSESFLWDHTTQVTSIAYQLALAEGLDPLIPVIAALFHDAGKFIGGKYHKDDIIEEKESARIAERILRQFGVKSTEIRRILSGLKALYNEKTKKNVVAAILHDADFLSKFGALGVGSFFIKSALRGRTLSSTVLGYLSKELTYAACLPLNMRTAAGCKLAARKAAGSLKFFRSLLAELQEAQIAKLKIKKIHVPHPLHGNRPVEIQLVVSPNCPDCGARWNMSWETERAIKCDKLIVDWTCSRCSRRLETSFCLPEMV